MSALALAMLLTGAGAVMDAPAGRPSPPAAAWPAPPAPWGPNHAAMPRHPRPAIRTRPVGNDLLRDADYPASARRIRTRDYIDVVVEVDPRGRVSDCVVMSTSLSPELDAVSCRMLRERARFVPARDAGGRTVFDAMDLMVVWPRDRDPRSLPPADSRAGGR